MSSELIKSTPRTTGEGGIKLALGSHNARSIGTALAQLEKNDLPTNALELQMLYGMGSELKTAAIEMGLRLREYVPVGEMIPGMAYLVRRLLENTSNESWLRAGFLDNASEDDLLRSPHQNFSTDPGINRITEAPERHELSTAVDQIGDGRAFFTEPMRDFSEAAARTNFASSIQQARVPEIANDTTVDEATAAVGKLHSYFPTWSETDYQDRADVLIKASQIMKNRRDELAGIVIKENGKPWRDADAEVCEAIDFCEFYAREGHALFTPRRLGNFIGEIDETWNQAKGVAAVISPWNFPLAICAGMCTAALVTGNVVALKPAEQTPGIAAVLVEILREAGLPREALSFLPGPGETVGAAIVRDPRVSLIAFTGSRAVGLDIIAAAGGTSDEQNHVKKVVCEMGGKNAIIIDASADLDEAVLGVRHSAFGFSGQKCSACSRVIVVDSAHDHFLKRLVESTQTLVVGNPVNPGTDVGPVIDQEAANKIQSFIEQGGREGTIECQLAIPEGLADEVGLPYIGPTIVSGISADDQLASEEIFGPVLSVIRVSDFDEALNVANSTQYKLTGGVFSRKPSHLDRARREFRVGNLYLNRGITGALVGRQPFGGFGMSGVGSKAGGLEYLQQFVDPRACSENAMRRGFAPGL
jgi:RHH-type proline utilization regulon transcriptional repressor/proline dehydrogenase/delta 1-pyrroline-5-carboxylate dehydrogenase